MRRRTWRTSPQPPTATPSRPARKNCACRSRGPTARASPSPRRSSSRRGRFIIDLEYEIDNTSQAPWQAALVRAHSACRSARRTLDVQSRKLCVRGPVIYDGTKYQQARHREQGRHGAVDRRHQGLDRRHAASLRERVVPNLRAFRKTVTMAVTGREYYLTTVSATGGNHSARHPEDAEGRSLRRSEVADAAGNACTRS